MTIARLVECTDHDVSYGFLIIEGNVSASEVQEKIYKLKNSPKFRNYDWLIEDILDKLPKKWKVSYYAEDTIIEI